MSLIEKLEFAFYGGAGAVLALGDWQAAASLALIAVAITLAKAGFS